MHPLYSGDVSTETKAQTRSKMVLRLSLLLLLLLHSSRGPLEGSGIDPTGVLDWCSSAYSVRVMESAWIQTDTVTDRHALIYKHVRTNAHIGAIRLSSNGSIAVVS